MTNISLALLDEYAKKLSNTQVNMLYESKTNKKYKKALFENAAPKYKLYLDMYTIAEELNANKAEFMMWMNEKYKSLMESISYKIDSEAITFSTPDRIKYRKLVEALQYAGLSGDVLEEMLDKKY